MSVMSRPQACGRAWSVPLRGVFAVLGVSDVGLLLVSELPSQLGGGV